MRAFFLVGTALLFLGACAPKASPDSEKWVGSWATSPQLVEPHNMAPEPGLSNNTLRQIVRISLGGDSIRLRFSNEFSNEAVTFLGAEVALSAGASAIVPGSSKQLLFNGEASATIPAGGVLVSDALAFSMEPRSDLSITISFGNVPADVTGHPGSRTTSFLVEGQQLGLDSLPNAIPTDHWYLISGLDVKAPEKAGAIVTLGNSITDGRGSGTNLQNRWPDILAERLQERPETQHIAVLNHGIGGNCVLKPCLGPAAVDRFERDVLGQTGVRWLIILIGVNDLGQTPDAEAALAVADGLIEAFSEMIDKAKAQGITVYGAPILPFGESFYDAPHKQPARLKVNDWIRNSGKFDAVIDFDLALADPENPGVLLPDVHTGDFLHPNEYGYRLMGEFVDLNLFTE